MQIPEFIAQQPADRQKLMTRINEIILANDKSVKATVGKMMGKEMILYHAPGTFKYGLASVKNYMSLHVMPIYGSSKLYERYKERLPLASFQKGCINFKSEEELPPEVVEQLLKDCAPVDLGAMKADWERSRAAKKDK